MTENDSKRDKLVHLAFSESEKQQVKDSAEELSMTISEFCRQAIFEKIRRMKNPEIITQGNTSQLNAKLLDNLMLKMKDMAKTQDLILEKTDNINEMNKLLEKIALYSEKQDFVKEKAMIINLLKSHSSLTQKQLINMTNLNKVVVFKVISLLRKEKKIEMTGNGRFRVL